MMPGDGYTCDRVHVSAHACLDVCADIYRFSLKRPRELSILSILACNGVQSVQTKSVCVCVCARASKYMRAHMVTVGARVYVASSRKLCCSMLLVAL